MQADETNFASIHLQAQQAAAKATQEFLDKHGDRDCCGFAWVKVYGVRLNSKLGKAMAAQGFRKGYSSGIELWNPSGNHTQCITAKEEGASAYAKVLCEAGLKAYASSRLD